MSDNKDTPIDDEIQAVIDELNKLSNDAGPDKIKLILNLRFWVLVIRLLLLSIVWVVTKVIEYLLINLVKALNVLFFIPLNQMMYDQFVVQCKRYNVPVEPFNSMIDGYPKDDITTPLLVFLLLMNITFKLADTLVQTYMTLFQFAVQKEYRTSILPPETAIRASFVAPEKRDYLWDRLSAAGYPEADKEAMVIAQYQMYSVDTVRELYFRGVLDKETSAIRLREMGFTDIRINEMVQSWDIIPSIQDLLTMVGHEAFEPDMISKYGLDDEFPVAQSEWMNKMGLNDFWQHRYWNSHWSYPSYTQVLDMLYKKIIEENEVSEYFKVVEIPPFWRDKLIKANYKALTRVDVRRIHAMGDLTDNDLINAYMTEGYNLENATIMAKFTIKYNQGNAKEISRSSIEEGYELGVIDKDTSILWLMEIGYGKQDAEFYIHLKDSQIEKSTLNEYIDSIKTLYQQEQLTREQARVKLFKRNLTTERVDLLLDKWDVINTTKLAMPTKAELEKLLMNSFITIEEYENEMRKLGYKQKYITWFEQLIIATLEESMASQA